MSRIGRLLALTLALVLTLTGIGAAQSRGGMPSDAHFCLPQNDRIVIAGDGLPLFDGDGQPVKLGAYECLDCLFSGLAVPSTRSDPVRPVPNGRELVLPPHLSADALQWRMGGKGRSPPRAA